MTAESNSTTMNGQPDLLDKSSSSRAVTAREVPLEDGAVFQDKESLIHALKTHAALNGYGYRMQTSNTTTIIAVCKQRFEATENEEKCPFRLYAKGCKGGAFTVRSWKSEHTCGLNDVTYRSVHGQNWVADMMFHTIKDNPDYPPNLIISEMRRRFGAKIDYTTAWRAREVCRKRIAGTRAQTYAALPGYLARYNDANDAFYAYETHNGRYLRHFVTFKPCLAMFKHCRPVISVDACHLKGEYKGQLFGATCLDGQNEMVVLAFAVCNIENIANWTWFLQHLEHELGRLPDHSTLISDRQKGLVEAASITFNNCQKSMCLKHLADNVKKNFKCHATINSRIWQGARTYDYERLAEHMDFIKEVDENAYQYLVNSNPELWANSLLVHRRFNILTSNVSECFNSWIGEEQRTWPVLQLTKHIIAKVSQKFFERSQLARHIQHHPSGVLPFVRKKLLDLSAVGRRMNVLRSALPHFLVASGTQEYNVDTSKPHCDCGHWGGNGYPCAHACAALLFCKPELGMDVYDHVEDYFRISEYVSCYTGHVIVPSLPEFSASVPEGADKPPMCKRQPGRPAKRRKEALVAGRRTHTCSRCGKQGHNRASCQEAAEL